LKHSIINTTGRDAIINGTAKRNLLEFKRKLVNSRNIDNDDKKRDSLFNSINAFNSEFGKEITPQDRLNNTIISKEKDKNLVELAIEEYQSGIAPHNTIIKAIDLLFKELEISTETTETAKGTRQVFPSPSVKAAAQIIAAPKVIILNAAIQTNPNNKARTPAEPKKDRPTLQILKGSITVKAAEPFIAPAPKNAANAAEPVKVIQILQDATIKIKKTDSWDVNAPAIIPPYSIDKEQSDNSTKEINAKLLSGSNTAFSAQPSPIRRASASSISVTSLPANPKYAHKRIAPEVQKPVYRLSNTNYILPGVSKVGDIRISSNPNKSVEAVLSEITSSNYNGYTKDPTTKKWVKATIASQPVHSRAA